MATRARKEIKCLISTECIVQLQTFPKDQAKSRKSLPWGTVEGAHGFQSRALSKNIFFSCSSNCAELDMVGSNSVTQTSPRDITRHNRRSRVKDCAELKKTSNRLPWSLAMISTPSFFHTRGNEECILARDSTPRRNQPRLTPVHSVMRTPNTGS